MPTRRTAIASLAGVLTVASLAVVWPGLLHAAVSRPVVQLDGDPTVRTVISEDFLFTQGGAPGAEFGSAVAFGDIDGDGFEDAIVGQRALNRVLVYLGAALPGDKAYFLDPNAADVIIEATGGGVDRIASFGFSLGAVDLDLDGKDDILIGAPFSDPSAREDAGLAYLVMGSQELADAGLFQIDDPNTSVVIHKLTRGTAASDGDLLGFSVAGGEVVGPVDAYLAVSARNADGAAAASGVVHVMWGSALLSGSRTIDLTVSSTVTFVGADAQDAFGESLAACDVDGSGDDDLVVGVLFGDGPANAGLNRGEVRVFLGENIDSGFFTGSVPASAANLTIHGAQDGDDLGFSVACGDVNDDAWGDVIAGALFADSVGDARPSAGEAYVFRGRVSQVDPNNPARRELLDPVTLAVQLPVDLGSGASADLVLFGATTADQLGFSVAVGDVDGDSIGDVIVGARRYDADQTRVNVGITYLIQGGSGLFAGAGVSRSIDLHTGTSPRTSMTRLIARGTSSSSEPTSMSSIGPGPATSGAAATSTS